MAGLKVFTYWETYVAGLEYLAIFLTPMILFGMVMEKGEGKSGAVGCIGMLLLPLLQVAAIAVFVLTLAPIIFGFTADAAWSFPWKVIMLAPGAFFKLVVAMIFAAIVLAFIPIIDRFQSLHTLVLGGIALIFVLSLLDSINPGAVIGRVEYIPGFWFSVGLIIIGGIMSWVGVIVTALLATAIDMAEEDVGRLIMFPFGAIFGFIPVFMYGAWLGAQVKNGL